MTPNLGDWWMRGFVLAIPPPECRSQTQTAEPRCLDQGGWCSLSAARLLSPGSPACRKRWVGLQSGRNPRKPGKRPTAENDKSGNSAKISLTRRPGKHPKYWPPEPHPLGLFFHQPTTQTQHTATSTTTTFTNSTPTSTQPPPTCPRWKTRTQSVSRCSTRR